MAEPKLYDPVWLDKVEILPGIWHVTGTDKFDLAMTFLRSQEFYESDNKQVKGKDFSMIEYIRWYARKRSSRFTYASDWAGFNVPSGVIRKALKNLGEDEFNVYDQTMWDMIDEIDPTHNKKFYLIGTMMGKFYNIFNDPNGVLHHELAHAFYYLDKEYKKSMDEILASMADVTKKRIYNELESMGYHKKVWDDEIQAYMIAGIEGLNPLLSVKAIQKKFKKVFEDKLSEYETATL